ncbi:ABC transporter ATP-binding protein [Bosea sp. LjRoot9]|uniref:ABC transporter ATP-binding protein n=1 Tax=Bosea sp. LjRoot9 TaxID=3342341 RepID=UPI003ECF9CF4
MLEVQNLKVSYGRIEALKTVSLNVGEGEFVGAIGSNGAGKTSLLMAISGAVGASGGRVSFDGEDITHLPQHLRVSRGIAIVPEGRQVLGPLSVIENLELGAYCRRRQPRAAIARDLDMVLELFPILRQRAQQLAATLSGGEQQMLAIGRALMSRPKLLLLDEPSFGLAPKIFAEILATLRRLHADGLACLMVEQDAHVTLETTSRSYVFRTGQIIMAGSSSQLRERGLVLVEESYLGAGELVQ